MKKLLPAAAAAVLALALSGTASAATGTVAEGGTTIAGGVATLVSNTGDAASTNDWSSLSFTGTGVTTFASLTRLGAEFNATDDGCAGGSPRFALSFGDKTLQVYVGMLDNGNFVCALDTWLATGNLVGSTTARFDLTQFGGPFYGTYAQALELLGAQTVTGIRFAVDGGWAMADKEQTVLLRSIDVNAKTLLRNKPKNAAQCKKGGWKSFTDPAFKNQGQCVKHVVKARNAAKKAAKRGR